MGDRRPLTIYLHAQLRKVSSLKKVSFSSTHVLLMGALLSGCLVGPNYKRPDIALPDAFSEAREQEVVAIEDDQFFEWWRRLNDPLLDELIEESAKQNFDLRIALERIVAARSNFLIQGAALLPQINLDSIAARSRNSRSVRETAALLGFEPTFQDFYLAGFDAIWQIDVFGGLERAKRASFNQWQATAEEAAAVQLTVLSEVAMTYVLIRSLQQTVRITTETIENDQMELMLIQERFTAGLARENEVLALQATLDADVALLKSQEIALKQGIYSLGVLLGTPPEWVVEKFSEIGSIPFASGLVPAELPSDLLRRRPDIISQERILAAATEQIGVAVAELFPTFSLTSANLFGARSQSSNFGFASNDLGKLFRHVSTTWSIGLQLFMPLVDFGRRIEAIHVQTSLQKQALLSYEKTVITALQEVEDALVAYFKEEERQDFLRSEVEANRCSWVLVESLFCSGLDDYTKVVEAKKIWLASEQMLINSEGALVSNLIALYKALGGEWACFYLP